MSIDSEPGTQFSGEYRAYMNEISDRHELYRQNYAGLLSIQVPLFPRSWVGRKLLNPGTNTIYVRVERVNLEELCDDFLDYTDGRYSCPLYEEVQNTSLWHEFLHQYDKRETITLSVEFTVP